MSALRAFAVRCRRAALTGLARLPWVVFGAILTLWSSRSDEPAPPTRRRLLERCSQAAAPAAVAPELQRALGLNGSILLDMQAELVSLLTAGHLRRRKHAWAREGPLKPYYKTVVQDGYARLHQLLFDVQLLPLSSWGGRFDFERPLPDWLEEASTVGRGGAACRTSRTSCVSGTMSRLGLNMFLQQHAPRVPSNATCLGIDVATQYLPVIPGCAPERMWALKYEPDHPEHPRTPRLNRKLRWATLDLMSVQSPKAAGEAHAMFDLAVLQETFEHIRFPYRAAAAVHHLLKPGGHVLWTAPFSTKFHLIPGDYFRYTVDGARALFVDAGFEIVGLHRMGDTALATGYDLGLGSADFTPRHLKAKLLQEVTEPEGKAYTATESQEALYISSAVAARKPLDGAQRSRTVAALSMGRRT